MYVNINGKLVKLTTEEYEALIANESIPTATKGPLSKMDELIASVNSVSEAISSGGSGQDIPEPIVYTLTKEGTTIRLEGTDNSVSSVEDANDNTTYNLSIADRVITLAGSDNSRSEVELPEESTAILSQSWDAENKEYGLTVTDNDGEESSVVIQYHLIKNIEANQIVLMAGDKPVDAIQLAQDQDTKYTIEKVGNEIRLIPSDGSAAIPIELDPDLNTTYELSFNPEEDTLTLTPNDNSLPQVVSLSKFADATAVEEALAEYVDKDDYAADMATKADKSEIPDISGLAEKTYVDTELAKKANVEDIPDVSEFITAEALDPYVKTEDLPDLTPYAKTEDVNTELAKKANVEDIPDVSEFITATALEPYATTEVVNTALEQKADKSEIPDVSGFATTESVNTALANKADKSEIPDVSEFITATALEPYAKSEDIPDVSGFAEKTYVDTELGKKANVEDIPDVSGFAVKTDVDTALESKADKSEIPDVSEFITATALEPYATTEAMNTALENYATNDDVDAVSSWATEEFGSVNSALRAQIDILNKMIREIKYPEVEEMEIDMDISASDKDIAISGDVSGAVRNITNANSVLGENVTIENGRIAVAATEDVEFKNLNTNGALAKSTSNAAMSINNNGNVVIKESGIEQNSYNAIEIGLGTNVAPKNVLIDNVQFTGTLSNNAISVFGWQEGAEIVISNCVFENVSNPIRLSNKTNVPCKVKFINCTCNKWDSNPDYAGFLLLQDYTSASAAEAEEANRFANMEITFENCYGPEGVKIEGDAEALCNPEHQIVYLWRDKGGKVAYDATKFPKISAF